MTNDPELRRLMDAIASADDAAVPGLLAAAPALARAALQEGATRAAASGHFLGAIGHYVYAGDIALHVAAAAHRPDVARRLIALGADSGARNRRGATPLHYAADGRPGVSGWDPSAQAATIACLIGAGADPDAADRNGVGPLHRAVRTRSAAAVEALLRGGADRLRRNGNGSTPAMLAAVPSGRSGSGGPEAKAEQVEIIRLLERRGGA
jgi:Ankyrin repeats (many copies)